MALQINVFINFDHLEIRTYAEILGIKLPEE